MDSIDSGSNVGGVEVRIQIASSVETFDALKNN